MVETCQFHQYTGCTVPVRVFTTFCILKISYISNAFSCFVYHSKMDQISRNYTKFFYANLYNIPRYFQKFCDLLYQFFKRFSTDNIFYTQQRNFKTLIGGGGGTTVHPSTPTPSLLPVGCLQHFVYSKFCLFRMFFLFRIPFENILFGSGFIFQ
jgi:hypothetical protein